jgi:hypothetical protein
MHNEMTLNNKYSRITNVHVKISTRYAHERLQVIPKRVIILLSVASSTVHCVVSYRSLLLQQMRAHTDARHHLRSIST